MKLRITCVIAAVCLCAGLTAACGSAGTGSSSGGVTQTVTVSVGNTSADSDGVYAQFDEKIDGDTAWFLIDGERTKVRFLGIDTPETVKDNTEVQPWGPEASEYTTERLSEAEEIYLEFDPDSDREDAYGRTLAWIWVDGSLLETELLERGYAEVAYIYGDYLYTDDLYQAQEEAEMNHVGLWSDSDGEVGET